MVVSRIVAYVETAKGSGVSGVGAVRSEGSTERVGATVGAAKVVSSWMRV